MITPFFQTDQSLIWAMLRVGTFSTPRHSYALGDFGRLPLLLPERDALNLKAFCPGLISPYSPGVFISRPPVMPGVFIAGAASRRRARIEPRSQHRRRHLEAGIFEAREKLDGNIRPERRDFSFDPAQDFLRGSPRQFIGFGEKDMHRLSGGAKPPEQSSVELGERVPHVHHDSEAPQGCAHLKICAEQFLPGCAYRLGHLGVAVAGKIDEESLHAKRVEIDESGASGGLAHECDSAARERVNGA